MDPVLPDIPWNNLLRLLHRLSHNLRNQLNTADLEASLAQELTREPEVRQSLAQITRAIRAAADEIQSLQNKLQFGTATFSPVRFAELIELWRKTAEKLDPLSTRIEWTLELDERMLELDLASIIAALIELLENALSGKSSSEPLVVHCRESSDYFTIRIEEPLEGTPDISEWGRLPFAEARHRHYGVGAWHARLVIEANGGTLGRRYDRERSRVVTDITFLAQQET
jgi:K+-sensing histidine kinase KdpD